MRTGKVILSSLILSFVWVVTAVGIAQAQAEKLNVVYAGFAFLGEHADIASDYKYSQQVYSIKASNGRPVVEHKLAEMLLQTENSSMNIITDRLGQLDGEESVALAVALDWEDVTVEKIEEGLIKSVYNLHGQVLLFSFASMEIVGCYPFGVRVTDSTPEYPSEEHKIEIFKKLYLDAVGDVNFLKSLSELVNEVKVDRNDSNLTFKVEEIVLEPKAQQFLEKNFPDQREQAFKIFVAQQFSSFFAKNLKLSILPYTKGKAIGNKMAGRFANGDVFELQIPEGDYPVTITIRGFKKAKLDENATGQSWAYGSYIHLGIQSALGDVVNTRIKNAAVKIVPAGQNDVADRSAFVESLLALFDKTTKQVVSCDSKWFKKCADGAATKEQFITLKDKIAKY